MNDALPLSFLAFALSLPLLYWYFTRLENILQKPDKRALPCLEEEPTDVQLQETQWRNIDELKDLPSVKGINHFVVGGSGSVGSSLVDLLQKAGAESIRVIDILDPPEGLLDYSRSDFFKTDLKSFESVHAAFLQPLRLPDSNICIHHTASVIRFYERLPYLRSFTYDVNEIGTSNITKATESLPGKKRLIYTSSCAVQMGRANFFRLTRSDRPVLYDGQSMKEDELGQDHYVASKRAAERIVLEANGKNGITSFILRPGMAVVGPRDLFIGIYLAAEINPIWASNLIQNSISARDVARAHIVVDAALRQTPERFAGETYLVTGDKKAWNFGTYRSVTQRLAGRDLHFKELWAAPMLYISCLIEGFLWLRYQILTVILRQKQANPTPNWARDVKFLQPATFFAACSDVIVDDSRARKELGWKPVWTKLATVKWVVDVLESKRKRGKSVGKSNDGEEILEHSIGVPTL